MNATTVGDILRRLFSKIYITHALKQGTLFAIGLSEDPSIPYLKDKEKSHEEKRKSDHTCDYSSAGEATGGVGSDNACANHRFVGESQNDSARR
jgi:hypothetical protein